MITIQYPCAQKSSIMGWQGRLDGLFTKYSLVENNSIKEALLTEGKQQASGSNDIDTYLDEQERLVAGWYEDRCDLYDFDPDAVNPGR